MIPFFQQLPIDETDLRVPQQATDTGSGAMQLVPGPSTYCEADKLVIEVACLSTDD